MKGLIDDVRNRVALAKMAVAEATVALGDHKGLSAGERAQCLWLLGRLMSCQDLLEAVYEDLRALNTSDSMLPPSDEAH